MKRKFKQGLSTISPTLHHYQQNKQPPLTSNHSKQTTTSHLKPFNTNNHLSPQTIQNKQPPLTSNHSTQATTSHLKPFNTNNHLSPETIQHKQPPLTSNHSTSKVTMTYDIEHAGPGLGQTQKYGG